jgi:hypothetical protein
VSKVWRISWKIYLLVQGMWDGEDKWPQMALNFGIQEVYPLGGVSNVVHHLSCICGGPDFSEVLVHVYISQLHSAL